MFRNEGVTIPETSLFNSWIHRSLCFDVAFPICMFSIVVPLLLFVLPFRLLFAIVPVFFCPVFGVPLCVSSVSTLIF